MPTDESEVWANIPGFDSRYEVSSFGNVRSWTARGKGNPLTCRTDRGFKVVNIKKAGGRVAPTRVGTLVAAAFLGVRPDKHHTRHKNGDGTDCSLSNLEYTSDYQSVCYKGHTKVTQPSGAMWCVECRHERSNSDPEEMVEARFSKDALREIMFATGHGYGTLARKIGVNANQLQGYRIGRSKPKVRNVKKLASGLGVSYEDLLTADTEAPPVS